MDSGLYAVSALIGTLTAIPLLVVRIRQLHRQVADLEASQIGRAESLQQQLVHAEAQRRSATERYERLKQNLSESDVVETYFQPVLLVGPRGVGKTSLLSQWKAPWTQSQPSPTFRHNYAEVPVCDLPEFEKRPHFADPDILTPVHAHLMLRVHDFAGEVSAQQLVEKTLRDETRELRQSSRRELGVIIVCLFDASDVVSGISRETSNYYNGELFQRLRNLVFVAEVKLERLILVFNKYDRLRQGRPASLTDADLLDECFARFVGEFRELRAICNPDRMCGVLTMLSREGDERLTRGANVVLGEAARAFVASFGGESAVQAIAQEKGAPLPTHFMGPVV